MRGHWCYWKEHFSAEKCDEIIRNAKELPLVRATVGMKENASINEDIRRSEIRWVTQNGYWCDLFDEMSRITKRSNDDWFDVRYTHLPNMQFTEYDSEYLGEYKVHQDVAWPSTGDVERKLSFVIQLSDPNDYEGGELKLHNVPNSLPQDVIKTRGTVIFFPSLIFHEVTPVTKGVRYSLVGWWEGPNWR